MHKAVRILSVFILLAMPSIAFSLDSKSEDFSPWLVYYSNKAPLETFSPYRLLIFDSLYHPPLALVDNEEKVILGYLSLGEVGRHRSYFSDLKEKGLLLMENKNWKGSFFIDLRNSYWSKLVIEELIPKILQRGFEGIFFDTLDNAAYLENLDSRKYKGMKAAAVELVKTIRQHYPDITIMQNRGYELLGQTGPYLNLILGESVYTHYSFSDKEYSLQPADVYQQQVELLRSALKSNPALKIFTLDYWNIKDTEGIKKIYAEQRKNGFIPYVSTIELTKVVAEPK